MKPVNKQKLPQKKGFGMTKENMERSTADRTGSFAKHIKIMK
jgi:hypothetical protein